MDAHSQKVLPAKSEFVSALHHKSWIVQINELKQRRRDNLEKLLSIFDQSATTDSVHILNVDEEYFPEEYREIIRRLRKAMEDPEKRRIMEVEDEIFNELKNLERQIKQQENTIEALQSNNQALQSDNQAQAKRIEELERQLRVKSEE